MMEKQKRVSLQDILQSAHCFQFSNDYTKSVLEKIKNCRTEKLGWHLYECNNSGCKEKKMQYHSCRNRHCPNCGSAKTDEWIEERRGELFPCPYFHVVFTIPHELNSVCMGNRKWILDLLFKAASHTLLKFASDHKYLSATPGIIEVLHTWGQQLSFHPHLHCIVSGGGISKTEKWKQARRSNGKFLFPVKALQKVYKGFFMDELKTKLDKTIENKILVQQLYAKEWIVYAKSPFLGPEQVLEYLGRYTHKVAISNHRIISFDDKQVCFAYKDYANGGKKKSMTLSTHEFLRRFEQHILPKRFVKIRSIGYLANKNRTYRINKIREQFLLNKLPVKTSVPFHLRILEKYGINIMQCPCCGIGKLQLINVVFKTKNKTEMKNNKDFISVCRSG